MELVLTGRNFTAFEAEKWGVVSRVVGADGDGAREGQAGGAEGGEEKVVVEAVEMARAIAGKGQLAVQAGKEAVNAGEFYESAFGMARSDCFLSLAWQPCTV